MKKLAYFGVFSLFLFYSCTSEVPSKKVASNVKPIDKNKTIKVGKGPDALFLTPDEKYLYVANVGDNFISVINTQTEKVEDKIEGIKYPWGFTRLGNTNLVAVSGYDKQIVLIDFSKHKIVKQKSLKKT